MSKAVSTFLRSAKTTSDTVVVLLGWAGARDEHLEKYCKLYTERGYDTLRYTATLPNQWDSRLIVSRDVKPVANDLRRVLETNDIAFHVLSMNGIFTLCSLALQYPELQLLQKAKGILFDSAPVSLGIESIGSFMQVMDHANRDRLKEAGMVEQVKFRLLKGLAAFKMLEQHFMTTLMRMFGGDIIKQYNAYDFLWDHPDLPKILYFVYSDSDTICPSFYIEKFAKHQDKKEGKLVKELHFKDSRHVLHYRKYPGEYNNFVDLFLEDIKTRSRL